MSAENMYLLNEEQALLQESAAGFFEANGGTEKLRALRAAGEAGDRTGYDTALSAQMAEMGFFGVLLPEAAGGTRMGAFAAGLIAGEMGRTLSAAPFLSSAVLSATALAASGTEALAASGSEALAAWGPKIADGKAVIAFAHEEGVKHGALPVQTVAEKDGNGFRLSGAKTFVADGFGADKLIVSAVLDGAPALFLVDTAADGVSVSARPQLDSRNSADVNLSNVRLAGEALIADDAGDVLATVLRTGRAVSAAEQIAVGREAAGQAFAYLQERRQFGRLIGSFQALQHRAAHLYCEIESTQSLVFAALKAVDAGAEDAEMLTRAAKAKAAQTARLATEEAVQMHGGIGMTDATDMGLFMKRDRVLTEFLGDANHHIAWLLESRGI